MKPLPRLDDEEIVIRFESALRVFGSGAAAVRALGPIDLEIRRGEFVAILGPSGSGKSTLLALSGALDVPTSGRVDCCGVDVARASRDAIASLHRREIGFVLQEPNLIDGLTAAENVALPLELDGLDRRAARSEAIGSLRRVLLDGRADHFPHELSGGERQRVAIARALVGGRRLLLADEPTGALDSLTGEHVMRLLRAARDEDRTIVLVTHEPAHAAWADRVVHLRDGRIEEPRSDRSPQVLPRGFGA